jgi:hypothetical protein
MAKLYWRIKKNGKWTWIPAVYDIAQDGYNYPDGESVILYWPTEEAVE